VVRTLDAKIRETVSVKDFGAVGNGVSDDSAAFQAAVNAAIDTTGEVFVPAGSYLIGTSVDIPFTRNSKACGVKISGVSANSVGTKSTILQKSIETPAFTINAINVSMRGLNFTTWAGNVVDANGNTIVAVSATSNSITLSADPWPNQAPVIWACNTPQISTDGTPYTNCIQFGLLGAFYASSVTKNLNGTVTLNNVKGAVGTANAQVPLTVGYPLVFWVSLAHTVTPTNPNAGIIYLGVKENQFYDQLWFNQVTSAFTLSALGSGAGPGVGIGAVGFMSNIVCDQAAYFIKAIGDINNLQCVNSQFFAIQNTSFYAPSGSISSSTFSNNQVILGKFIQVNTDVIGCTIVGNNFNNLNGYGYSNLLINVGGSIIDTAIVGNAFGRSTSTCINVGSINSVTFVGNNITSNSELGVDAWLLVNTGITNSYFSDNNFAALYVSNNNRLEFTSATPTVSGSTFGGEWIGYQSGTKVVGWLTPTFQNSWANVAAGTQLVGYFKDQNGIVHIKGEVSGGVSGTVAFTLPAGYRPLGFLRVYGQAANGGGIVPMLVEINASGTVSINTTVTSWGDFGMISFPTR